MIAVGRMLFPKFRKAQRALTLERSRLNRFGRVPAVPVGVLALVRVAEPCRSGLSAEPGGLPRRQSIVGAETGLALGHGPGPFEQEFRKWRDRRGQPGADRTRWVLHTARGIDSDRDEVHGLRKLQEPLTCSRCGTLGRDAGPSQSATAETSSASCCQSSVQPAAPLPS